LTFSNPMLTFENDTGGSIVAGVGNPTPTCANKAICTIQSLAPSFSTTITLSPTMTVSATSGAGLLVDVNLTSLITATMDSDFKNGVTVSQFTPGGSDVPPLEAEDVIGQVGAIDATHSTFSLQNTTATYSLTVDNSSTFLQFQGSVCTTPTFACLRNGQIVSVDISFRADGTPVAKNVVSEEPDSTETDVEGIITGINSGVQQFTMITLVESASISNLHVGDSATVHYSTPQTPFRVDFTHADSTPLTTTGFLFTSPADLIVGQQVLVLRNPASSRASISADLVELRSTRVSGLIQTINSPSFQLTPFPSLFTSRGITPIQVQTSGPTICTGTGTISSCSLLGVTHSASVRGPLFANATTPTIVASRVIQH
jgi:hypothetical protein